MITETHLTVSATRDRESSGIFQLYLEGIVAGVIGAATIAIWFLILDTIYVRALYTPTVLGTALFRHGEGLASPENLPISLRMTLMYTWVHGLAFCVIGGIASRLLALAEQNPNVGFGILLFFVLFEFGFVATATVLRSLSFMRSLGQRSWSAICWRRHRWPDISGASTLT